ncbi:MAG: HAD hydrolase-like protein [Eubacteriales bacterium]|nr:HAD hydrolase-like protein [Eubacteriales bacterium]
MDKKYIFFDLDGTLTDSYEGIINSLLYALNKLNIKPQPDSFNQVIGPPLHLTFMDTYKMSPEESDKAVGIFREYYEAKGKFENIPYEGISETLHTLYAHGKKLMIATAKPEHMAVQIADHFGLSQYLCFIAGTNNDLTDKLDDPTKRSSKSDVIKHILKTNDIKDPENAVMVGDRAYDIVSAKALGLQTIGVTYGYGTREELEEAGADYIADTPMDIIRHIIED